MVVEPSPGQLTSDAGLLPMREFDERIGLTAQFAEALDDPRHQPFVGHSFREMVRSRIFGILADYPDQNDHDVLRFDPVFKLLAGRSPDAEAALSRCQNPNNSKTDNSAWGKGMVCPLNKTSNLPQNLGLKKPPYA